MADMRGRQDLSFTERFWARVSIGTDQECWPWSGKLAKGYGECQTSKETIDGVGQQRYKQRYQANLERAWFYSVTDSLEPCVTVSA